MPKVRLGFQITGWVTQTVDVPQEVINKYRVQVEGDDPDCEALDKMLEPYVRYDDILDQLDDPEDIELTEIVAAAKTAV